MFDELTMHILKRLEAFPDATFRESELVAISGESFDALVKDEVLVFDRHDKSGDSYCSDRMGDGDSERILRIKGSQISAFSPDPGVATIQLTKHEITYYRFDKDRLVQQIKRKNNLSGQSDGSVSERLLYIGTDFITNAAIFLGFFDDEKTAHGELLSAPRYDKTLAICPTFSMSSLRLKKQLENTGIEVASFDCVLEDDYTIDFSKVQFGRAIPKLTSEQRSDYAEHKYLCFDRLEIPGTSSLKRSNDLIVNGHKIKMPDRPFPLLIEMAVALKKGQGGWIKKKTQPGKYQIYGHLKNPLGGSLDGKDANKFIQNDAEKRYRISTHPDFVTYNKERLLHHSLAKVRELARKLP